MKNILLLAMSLILMAAAVLMLFEGFNIKYVALICTFAYIANLIVIIKLVSDYRKARKESFNE